MFYLLKINLQKKKKIIQELLLMTSKSKENFDLFIIPFILRKFYYDPCINFIIKIIFQ